MGKLTDREAWEWYLRPTIEKAKRMEAARPGRDLDEPWQPETPEDELEYMRRLGVVGVPDSPARGS